MKSLFITALALLTGTLAGCATAFHSSESNTGARPETLYEAQLVDANSGTQLSVDALAQRLAHTDIVVIGEYHGHQAAHLLQSRIQAALYRQHPLQVLSMEQFNLDSQAAVDAYLSGKTGETEFIEDSGAWDNYRASYRPLVEFARQHGLPVVAANAPAAIVRCVGRTGPDYLNKLPANERAQLPSDAFLDTPAYREKFNAAINSSHSAANDAMSERMHNTYQAQLLRDNTMANRILEARKAHPNAQIIHTTGTFHSEEHLGTVALLSQRAPDVSVAVISPVVWPADAGKMPLQKNRLKGDYLYFIQPLPQEFLDEDREHKAMSARFRRPNIETCEGDTL
ncbi:ChaN family lipoprotein [Marinobacter sp. DY40_1A1]|uniref:ChaN family lipoprotein n=1 Tax=Marinobacter sp. DY40_1A1 TaxID=2583229 RepID=UPI001905B873|nr:ChaN family lipoprotein [Marinobacter sp. DY40_1A1]MBK1886293.1 ChaN family lipoprotein [Marinobacter sp. DY40_1A1]